MVVQLLQTNTFCFIYMLSYPNLTENNVNVWFYRMECFPFFYIKTIQYTWGELAVLVIVSLYQSSLVQPSVTSADNEEEHSQALFITRHQLVQLAPSSLLSPPAFI